MLPCASQWLSGSCLSHLNNEVCGSQKGNYRDVYCKFICGNKRKEWGVTDLVSSRGVSLEFGTIKVLVWELFEGPGVKWWIWRAISWSVQLSHLWDVQVPPLRFGSILVFRQLPDKKYWRNRNHNSYLTLLGFNKIILRTATLDSQLYLTNVYFLFSSLGGRWSSID